MLGRTRLPNVATPIPPGAASTYPGNAMLHIRNLVKVYPGPVAALQGVSLEVPMGMFGLLGSNGASDGAPGSRVRAASRSAPVGSRAGC